MTPAARIGLFMLIGLIILGEFIILGNFNMIFF